MRIGYACVNPVLPDSGFKKCKKSSVTDGLLKDIISCNLDALEKLIVYNIENRIEMFRIGSDIIPFGSDEVNTVDWTDLYAPRFSAIGKMISSSSMRVSMHPGQYTVLNSPDENVRKAAVRDLEYHCSVLDLLGTDSSNKIVLHAGGAYGNKSKALDDFALEYSGLDSRIKDRLVLENDDRIFNITEVLELASKISVPVVFDNLHNAVNSSPSDKSDSEWVAECAGTWREQDGCQKIHYSQQDPLKRAGAHSERIDAMKFLDFTGDLDSLKPDIMLEVKDKNLSAIKCILCTENGGKRGIRNLEREWSLYKYSILERSPRTYNEIRQLLKDKDSYPVTDFYRMLDQALSFPADRMNARNAAMHVWGYFKDYADLKEKKAFFKSLDNYCEGLQETHGYKKILFRMANKYDQQYIIKSYYCFI